MKKTKKVALFYNRVIHTFVYKEKWLCGELIGKYPDTTQPIIEKYLCAELVNEEDAEERKKVILSITDEYGRKKYDDAIIRPENEFYKF